MDSLSRPHYYWIDWMKAIGMYMIVLGHFSPVGHEYIYVFNVPLFFTISGFLSKKETDLHLFWVKLWRNLTLPCIIICVILHMLLVVELILQDNFRWAQIPYHIANCIAGFHGLSKNSGGLGICWFIYTLALCRVIHQFVSDIKPLFYLVIAICICFAIWYNMNDINWYNAVSNTSLAYPIYAVGASGKELFRKYGSKETAWILMALAVICSAIVFFVGKVNGAPWMFNNKYGQNIILFFLGGIAGVLAIYSFSRLLEGIHFSIVEIISKGSIIILGFHLIFIRVWSHFIQPNQMQILSYIGAFVILCAFVPIIKLSYRYFPIILGTRSKC